MKIISDKDEKRVLRFYSFFAYIFLSIVSYFMLNIDLDLHLSFIKFVLISVLLMTFGGIMHGRWYDKAYRMFGERKFGKTVISGIFCFIILPLAISSSYIIYFSFHSIGLFVLNAVCIFFGALIRQVALDTIINVYRPEIEKVVQRKIKFKIYENTSK